jgi:hypothetical protein
MHGRDVPLQVTSLACVAAYEHSLHLNGFSPICMRM